MDEYVGAAVVWDLRTQLPHRDLALGKTVLAYYLQLPVLSLFADAWEALLAVKLEMAALTAATLAYCSFALARCFQRRSVVLGLALLVTMSTFFERAAEFRSDMPTALAGLVALVCLLQGRPALAGLWCGVSLMMSQKGAYYVLASEAALLAVVFSIRSRRQIAALARFNAAAAGAFAAYLLFWIAIAPPRAVLVNTFMGQTVNAFGTHFVAIRASFWGQTLIRNPLFWAFSAAALAHLMLRARKPDQPARLMAAYGVIFAALVLWHKQPWPYFFVLVVPVLFVLQLPLLDRLTTSSRATRRYAVITVTAAAVLSLVSRAAPIAQRDLSYQRATFRLGEALLADGGEYLAAVPILYRHTQPAERELASVDTVQRNYLLQLPQSRLADLTRAVAHSPVKFVVFNYRIDALPLPVRQYLVETFSPWWGPIFIYAPRVRTGAFSVHFSGDYQVDSAVPVVVDGASLPPGTRLRLARGRHTAASERPFRLRLMPAGVERRLDPDARELRELFADVYYF